MLIKYLNEPANENLQKQLIYESFNQLSVEQIVELTKETATRLQIPNDQEDGFIFNKVIELSYQKANEDLVSYNKRITSYFANILTEQEIKQKWNENLILKQLLPLRKLFEMEYQLFH